MKSTSQLASDYRPLVTVFAKKTPTGLSFININDTINITVVAEVGDVIVDILYLCNGHRSWKFIFGKLDNVNISDFENIADLLIEKGLVIDSREFYLYFHEYSRFPLVVAHDWNIEILNKQKKKNVAEEYTSQNIVTVHSKETHLTKIIQSRRSTRAFLGESLTINQIGGILGSMYSRKIGKSVPSAGGIYPITLYVVIFHEISSLEPGIYCYHAEKEYLIKITDSFFKKMVTTLIGTAMTRKAAAAIFVTVDFAGTTYKYANRGYRHALLEAGHVAQNAYLYCAENKIGITEYGGFNDVELSRLLNLNKHQAILTLLLVGKIDTGTTFDEPYVKEEARLRKLLCGNDKPVDRLMNTMFEYGSYVMPFYAASAKYRRYDKKNGYSEKTFSSFGLGESLPEARLKALAEAFERYTSSCYNFDRKCSEQELDAPVFSIDLSQSEDYKKQMDLVERLESDCITWKRGLELSSQKEVYVPCDQVFYPLQKEMVGHPLSYKSNSSGVATHSEYDIAVQNALLELIERDALAVMWQSKQAPAKISHELLDTDVRQRLEALFHLGHRVEFFDLTVDSIPVVLCLITGDKYPFTTSGCAARFDVQEAILKSFNEAEFVLHSWRKIKRQKKPITEIRSSTDHGDLYVNTKITDISEVAWIFNGRDSQKNEWKSFSIQELFKKFKPVVVDLTPEGSLAGLHTVRVLSNNLIPFSFGYASDHSGHPRLNMLGLSRGWEKHSFPHLLA